MVWRSQTCFTGTSDAAVAVAGAAAATVVGALSEEAAHPTSDASTMKLSLWCMCTLQC
jgi:hypothetical protein